MSLNAPQSRPGMQTLVLVSLLSSLAGGLFASVASVTITSAWRGGGGYQSFEVTETDLPDVGMSGGRRRLLQVPASVLSYNAAKKELTINAKAIKLISSGGGRLTVATDITLSTTTGAVNVAPAGQAVKFATVGGNVDITRDNNIIRFSRVGDKERGLQLYGADTAGLFTRKTVLPTSGIKIQTATGALGDKGAVVIAPGGRQLRIAQGNTQNVDIGDKASNFIRFDGSTTSLKIYGNTASGLYTLNNGANARIELQTAANAFGNIGGIFLAPGGRQLRVAQRNNQVDISDTHGNNIIFDPNNLLVNGTDTVCLLAPGKDFCIAGP